MAPIAFKTLEKWGASAIALAAIGALMYGVWPLVIGDYPPLASQERVMQSSAHMVKKLNDAQESVEALIIRGNILGAWRSCRQAVRDANAHDVDDYGAQIAMLQSDYSSLTGERYPLPGCP